MPTSAVLLDIEGTTTAISFVADVLFPYAAQALEGFLRAHAQEAPVAAACALIRQDALPAEQGLAAEAQVLAVVRRQMAGDVKATGLKQLQGLIWEHGYRSGALRAHVFPDVPTAFARWRAAGRRVCIYSSGSILAQRLLFGHAEAGDLTPAIAAYFDTTTGPKKEAASYTAIAQQLGLPPAQVLFATDQLAEAQAALAGGMEAALLMRPGNAPLPAGLPCAVHADLTRL